MKKRKKRSPKTFTKDEKKMATITIDGLPFIIHGAMAKPFFPTHTHGLYELNVPEFIYDPLAFGAEGNARRIFDAYNYLNRPENAGALDDIKGGATLKLTAKALRPYFDGPHPYTYCLRLVNRNFEGVKLAYFPDEIEPDMLFIQMYTDGDNFALMDDYYRGGVRW